MENQLPSNSPNALPSQSLPLVSSAKRPSTNSRLIMPILLSVSISAGVFGFGGYYLGTQKNKATLQFQSPSIQPTTSPQKETISSPTPTVALKTYTNIKHQYTVNYPDNFLVGFADVRVGQFNQSTGIEDQIDFLPSEADEFNNFLQIQVFDLKPFNKTFENLIDSIYQEQNSHFQTTNISTLIKSKFVGYDSFEYTFSGQAFHTPTWSGQVKEGNYKVVMFKKGDMCYFFGLKEGEPFNKILSTFKFVN